MPQAPSVAVPSRLPLILQPENRDSTVLRDAKLVNGYMEKTSHAGEAWVYKRPGLELATFDEAAGPVVGRGRGVYNWQGKVYAVFSDVLYEYDHFPATTRVALGNVNDTGGMYTFDTSLGDTPRLQLQNGVAGYNYSPSEGLRLIFSTVQRAASELINGVTYTIAFVGTSDFTLVGAATNTVGVSFIATGPTPGTGLATSSNANFPVYPNLVPGWAYLDGTTYVMDRKAYIHGSTTLPGMNTPNVWEDLTNVIGAQIEPDEGVRLAKQLVYVLALKTWSTEVFYDALNPPGASPLGPVQGAKINYGCAAADSVQELDGTLIWAATNRAASVQIVLLEALKLTIVSTKAVERLLIAADFTQVASMAFKYEGHRFYVLTLKANNLTLVYDLTDQMWAQWTDHEGNYFKGIAHTFFGTQRIVQHELDGQLYFLGGDYYDDAGYPITVDLYAPNFDGGTRRRKQLNQMEFVADQTAGSTLQVRVNDADYAETAWTNFRLVDLSKPRPLLVNCGTFNRRTVHLRHQSNTPFRLQAIELQLDIGTL